MVKKVEDTTLHDRQLEKWTTPSAILANSRAPKGGQTVICGNRWDIDESKWQQKWHYEQN